MAPAEKKKHTGPFRTLPAEIKNKIYRELLVGGGPIVLTRTEEGEDGERKLAIANYTTNRLEPTMLLLNKTIRRDTASILYGCNTFTYTHAPNELEQFLNTIGPRARRHIRSLHLSLITPYDQIKRILTLLPHLPQLSSLSIAYTPTDSAIAPPARLVTYLLPWLKSLIRSLRAAGQPVTFHVLSAICFPSPKTFIKTYSEEEEMDAMEYTLEVRKLLRCELEKEIGGKDFVPVLEGKVKVARCDLELRRAVMEKKKVEGKRDFGEDSDDDDDDDGA